MTDRRIILLGGAPTVGKTSVARSLSVLLGLPWICTDQIRRIMRAATDPSRSPALFGPTAPLVFLRDATAEDMAAAQVAIETAVWSGVRRFIERDHLWLEGFIVEGIAVLPDLVGAALDTPSEAVFLTAPDHEQTREAVFARGVAGPAASYPDWVKERELAWMRLFDERVVAAARRRGFPVVETRRDDTDAARVLAALGGAP